MIAEHPRDRPLNGFARRSYGSVSTGARDVAGPVLSIPGVRGAVVGVFFRNDVGIWISGVGCPAGIGRTTSGVIRTNSSELFLVTFLDWKSLPSTGMLPIPGTFEKLSCVWLSSRPAITKLWPLSSSTSVCTLRELRPGTVKPWMLTALL